MSESAKVSEEKKEVVKDFIELMDNYPVIGIVNMKNLPTKTVQKMRTKLREKGTVLKMTKKRLLKLAFAEAKKKGINKLEKHFKGMPALIFTEDNPFTLYSELERNKSNAPAKAGQEAPNDIQVKAGSTNFTPGPIIGQLGKYGIKTGVEGGKLAIKEDSIIIKAGDTIDADLAGILSRLGIEPIEIGLDLVAVYENGEIFTADVLHIDEEEYIRKIQTGYTESLNLAVETGYPTEESVTILIQKAGNESRTLALSSDILTDETTEDIIRKAHAESLSLSGNLPKETVEEKAETKKEVTETKEKAEKDEEKIEDSDKKEDVKEETTEKTEEEEKKEEKSEQEDKDKSAEEKKESGEKSDS